LFFAFSGKETGQFFDFVPQDLFFFPEGRIRMHFTEKGLHRKGFRGFQAGAAFAQYYREHFLERYP